MTSPTSIFERLRAILGEILERPPESINRDSALLELGATSLDILDMSATVEKVFGIMVHDRDLRELTTVEDVVGLIERKQLAPTS